MSELKTVDWTKPIEFVNGDKVYPAIFLKEAKAGLSKESSYFFEVFMPDGSHIMTTPSPTGLYNWGPLGVPRGYVRNRFITKWVVFVDDGSCYYFDEESSAVVYRNTCLRGKTVIKEVQFDNWF